ncbi:MAG: phospholipase D-like domain-containing protein [candidate division WOR-3 bacterium]
MHLILLLFILVTPVVQFDDSLAKVKTIFNEEYYETLESLLLGAKKEILIGMFQFTFYEDKRESYSNKLVDLLLDKAKQGVKIRIILEGGENFLGRSFRESHQKLARILNHKNIQIKFDKKGMTTHAKFVVVDDAKVILGSTNWTYYGLHENNESNVLIESERIAKKFKNYFDSLWQTADTKGVSYFDREIKVFRGQVATVEKKMSKKGNPYTIIYLTNGVRVYIRGHVSVKQRDIIKIEGKETTFRGKRQIEAYKVEILKGKE